MQINEEQIIKETKEAFLSSKVQQLRYNQIQDFINEDEYAELHTAPLVPLNIKIDPTRFENEILFFDVSFEQWGNNHQELPRYGLALVNQDGQLKDKDPINGSLYEWNVANPQEPLLELDCREPTDVMFLPSLKPLQIFDGHWCRSNILKFKEGAEFKPHIDTLIPSPWIRLWGTTNNNTVLRFAKNNYLEDYTEVEPGRLYIIDTSIVHDARCIKDQGYQFFLSVLPSAYKLLKQLKL